MRTSGYGLLVLLVTALGLGSVLAQDRKPTAADFFGVWIEEKRESGAKVYDDPFDLLGWDLAAEDGGCWLRRGGAGYSSLGRVRLRTDREPAWLDFIGDTKKVMMDGVWVDKVYIRPGIAKRDGKKLIWVWSTGWCVADPRDIADWSYRPKSIDVKLGDSWERMTLYRSSGRYTTD